MMSSVWQLFFSHRCERAWRRFHHLLGAVLVMTGAACNGLEDGTSRLVLEPCPPADDIEDGLSGSGQDRHP
jgi:hypothetical protein